MGNGSADGMALAECIAPLDDEDRRAVHRYWDRVIWEEWVPPVARRAMAAVARSIPLCPLDSGAEAA